MKKTKKVKAWAPTDGKNLLNMGTKVDGVFLGLFMVGTDKDHMEKQWEPFKVVPVTITYTIPS